MIGSIESKALSTPCADRAVAGRRDQRLSRTGRALATLLVPIIAPSGWADEVPASDENVETAIVRAVEWLKSRRNEQGHWERGDNTGDKYWAGDSALALLALLYADEDPRQDDMTASLEWLAAQPMKATYTRGVRAHVFALVPGDKYRRRLGEDLRWLVRAIHPSGSEHAGAYGYLSTQETRSPWYDNSNSQFGVLGVWMATEAGARVEGLNDYWKLIEAHWMKEQRPDGGWTYQDDKASTGSMTAAGLACLHVVLDRVHARTSHKRAQDVVEAIDRGLDWFGREFTPDNPHGSRQWKYYYLYGVERAGHASGRKYFRGRDWFRIGAADLLADQRQDGGWKSGLRDTCFALMFLCHGRAPLLFNKLEHGDDWNNYLRDVAGLTRYAEHVFEKLLNWQIVSLDGTLDDLLEAPVLYLSGRTHWEFDDDQVERLREYCLRGGMIFAVAQEEGDEFSRAIRSLAGELFPEYPLRKLPRTHPLFTGQVQFSIAKPSEMIEVHNGARTLLLLTTEDIGATWNRYQVRRTPTEFRLGCNVYLYATDKTAIHSRLQTPTIPLERVEIKQTIEVARIKYDGDWNVEPYGWKRLATYMNNSTATRLVAVPGVSLDSTVLLDFKVAHLTGTREFTLSPAELSGLRRFLTDGGTLLADAAGGSPAFIEALEEQLTDLLKVPPRRLPPTSPILTGQGLPGAVRLDTVGYRRSVRRPGRGRRLPPLKVYELGKRAVVIHSSLDISVGLLGTQAFDCRGYDPDSALRVARNMLLYASLSTAEKARLAGE
ncbi:MAG: DUF4159 domain-containing protein [Phycisphaerae bacterium]